MKFFIFLILVTFSNFTLAQDLSGWDQDASSYESIVTSSKNTQSPYLVYFYAEWCPWCKRLNTEYLNKYEIQQAIRSVPKVVIAPDKSSANKELMNKFGAKGYPSLYVVDPLGKLQPIRLSPFYNPPISASDFMQKINAALSQVYISRVDDHVKAKAFDKAIAENEKALEFDKSAFNYSKLGYVYHSRSMETKNSQDIAQAKINYEKALSINPNDSVAKSNLESLK